MAIDSEKLYRQFQASGLSRKEFAQKVRIPKSTLDYHVYKNRKKQSAPSQAAFKPLRLVNENKIIKITLANGTLIEIPS